jgi:putative membrane protein
MGSGKGAKVSSGRRSGRQILHSLVLSITPVVSIVTALVIIGSGGPALADTGYDPSSTAPSSGAASNTNGATDSGSSTSSGSGSVQLDTQDQPLSAADRDLVARVKLAGLWEIPAGQMAQTKGVEPRVRQVGQMIAAQHVQLNIAVDKVAKQLGITLPTKPTAEQQSWLDEMRDASGPAFDQIFVQRLRAAHGKIFAIIAVVRASTRNDIVRNLAQVGNGIVMNHLTYLESTGLVQYDNLPKTLAPSTGVVGSAVGRSHLGGISVPLIWLILAIALIAGMISVAKVVRPRSFGGGRHMGQIRRESAVAMDDARPAESPDDRPLYPSPRARGSARSLSRP